MHTRRSSTLRHRLLVRSAAILSVCFGLLLGLPPSATADPVLVSELVFHPGSPTYDPYGSGTQLEGEVDVSEGGWLDMRGRSVVTTPHRPSLNPGDADFSFGIRMALTRGVGSWNVMQKGLWSDDQWKLSIHRHSGAAQLSCRIRGSAGTVHVFTDGPVIAPDGTWHDVECARTGDLVELRVDGETSATGRGPTGNVSSSKPYLIGSKGLKANDPDQFLGLLDDARVAVDQPDDPGGGTAPPLTRQAVASIETTPVAHSGDAADDPALWRHPTDPSQSLLIGNDKGGALDVYNLDGSLQQRISGGFFGNVDVRTGLATANGVRDIAAVYRGGLRIYAIDPDARELVQATDDITGSIPVPSGGEGLCLYRSPVTSDLHAFVISRAGNVAQYQLGDADGDDLVDAQLVRSWSMGSESEGCVADDENGALYIAEEDVALWRYGAEPTDGTTSDDRTAVDRVTSAGGRLAADIEGVALARGPNGAGYLLVSAQAGSNTDNFYAVYERDGDNAYLHSFQVVSGADTDGCGRTDGIEAVAADLGPDFPQGVFVCQDNTNTEPGGAGNQNFKLVPLEQVVDLVTDPAANRAPTAVVAQPQCTALTCSFDGSGSTDPDGDPLTLTWELGDGTTATGSTAERTYDESGSYAVRLTATDPHGLSHQAERTVLVGDTASEIAFRGAAGGQASWNRVSAGVPVDSQPDDVAVLAVTANRSGVTLTAPAGWQPLGSQTDSTMKSQLWVRTLSGTDAGTRVMVTASVSTKLVAQVVVYSGVDPSDPLAAVESANETASGPSHTVPVAEASASAWGVFVWGNKTTSTTSWTVPPEVVARRYDGTGGSGRVTSLVADSGGPVGGVETGGHTALADSAGDKATMWTLVLRPDQV